MRTFDELEQLWIDHPPARAQSVRLICVRTGGGAHETPAAVAVTTEGGVEGDRWGTSPKRKIDEQITLMDARVAALIAGDDIPLHMPGDNFLIDLDLGEAALPVGARVRLGEVVVEVTPVPHTGCRRFGARFGQDALRWVNWHAHRARRLRGINCRVVTPGTVRVGDIAAIER